MIILGIDHGRKKIGFALSAGKLAEPLGVARVTSREDGIEKVRQAVLKHRPNLIVVGISEGKMAEEQQDFARLLAEELGVGVKTWDETLTTKDARSLSLAAGLGRSKRRKLEDAFAASLMLQSYLDHETASSS